jgi:hypothetical protein
MRRQAPLCGHVKFAKTQENLGNFRDVPLLLGRFRQRRRIRVSARGWAHPAYGSARFCRSARPGQSKRAPLIEARARRPAGRAKKSVHDFRFRKKKRLAHAADIAESRESSSADSHLADLQMPSFAFSSVLTACGLALPPVAFIA